MLGEILLPHRFPPRRRPPRRGVECTELVPTTSGPQLHPAEQGVADHGGEGPLVAGQGPHRSHHRYLVDLVGTGQLLPFVEQARIHLADKLPQPFNDVRELVGPRSGRNSRPQRLEGVGQVAQHRTLGAGQPVSADVLLERESLFPHLAHDGLRGGIPVGRPRVASAVHLEAVRQQLVERAWIGDVVEEFDALVVFDAFGLHGGDGLATGLLQLGRQDLARILKRRLDHRNHVERKGIRCRVEQLDGRQRERRQRLVQREIRWQVDGQSVAPPVRFGFDESFQHPGLQQ